MGKTFAAAKGEAAKCAMTMRYFGEHAAAMLENDVITRVRRAVACATSPPDRSSRSCRGISRSGRSCVSRVPNLMAGNVVLVKHAPNVPGCARYIENLFARAGFADGVFTNLFVETEHVASHHRRSPRCGRDARLVRSERDEVLVSSLGAT